MLQFKALVKDSNKEKIIDTTTIEVNLEKVDDKWYLLPSNFRGTIIKGDIKITKGEVSAEIIDGLTIKGVSIDDGRKGGVTLTLKKETIFKIKGSFKVGKTETKIFVKKGSKIFFFNSGRDTNFKTNYPSADVCFIFTI